MENEVKKLKERIIELEALRAKHKQSEETLRHALREAYDELEKQVEKRTNDLIVANMQLQQQIAERVRAEDALHYRVEFEKLITTLSTNFIKLSSEETPEGIKKALQMIGNFVDVDSIDVILFSDDGLRIGDIYTWCKEGIKQRSRNLIGRSIDELFPWFAKKIKGHGIIHISCCDELPTEANAEKEYFLNNGIKSIIAVPIFCSNSFTGFICFNSIRIKKQWEVDIVALLKIVGEIFVNTIERNCMEAALRKSENKYRLLFECASDGIALLDKYGNILDCNKAYMKLLGFYREEILGNHIAKFYINESKSMFKERFKKIRKDGQAESEIELVRKDGKILPIWCKVSAVYDDYGKFAGALKHCRDITEKKKNEQILRKSHQEMERQVAEHTDNLKAVKTQLHKEIVERRRAEDAKRLAYVELEQIFNTAADGMCLIDKSFEILQINNTFLKILGIKKDETIRKMCYEVFQTPLCNTNNCPLIRIFRGKDRIENIIEIQSRKNLKKISCILTATPFKGPNGELIGIIEDFKDINIHNLIQNKLPQKVSIDQQLIEISTDGSYVTDVEGNLMDANPVFCNLIGYSKEELLCMKIKDLEIRKTSHEKQRKKIKREIARFETQYRHKNGKIIWIKIFTVLIHRGIKEFFVSSVHDITEHKEMQMKMQFLSYALEHCTDGIALTNLDGHLIYINKTFASIHGYDPKELLGKHISIFYPSQLKQYLKIDNSQTNAREEFKSGVWHARHDGTIFPAIISKSLLKDKAGNPIGIVIIIKEINKREGYNIIAREKKNTEQVLLDTFNDSALLIDSQGTILTLNEKAAQNLNKRSDELLGMSFYDLFPSKLALARKKQISETVRLAKPVYFEEELGGRQVDYHYYPVLDKQGKVVKIAIFSRDITRDIKGFRKKDNGPKEQEEIESDQDRNIYIYSLKNKGSRKLDSKKGAQNFALGKHIRENAEYKQCLKNIISCSERIWNLFDIIPSVAESVSTVLLQGESGTGKHLFANAIHNLSPRKEKPFITLNCGALPDTLLESELFGYKAGAFTDAKKDKLGRFALADGGTLFLDEIGDISPAMQIRLLHFLQERVYEPLGSEKSIKANVRIIAATNKDLMGLVKKGKFRQDLFYRINVVRLDLPPLRERLKDVPLLIKHFINQLNEQQDKKVEGITDDACISLLSYDYPGNIRELENIIEHAFVLCRSGKIERRHLPEFLYNSSNTDLSIEKEITPFMKVEADYLINVLRQNNWNRLKTARQLGIHKATLFRKIKSLGLKLPHSGKHSNS